MMKSYPLVSIIIPTYNSAKFLPYTLRSIQLQDYVNIETILIDDGSTDRTENAICSFKRINYIKQQNKGLSAARNTGINLAKGDLILFLDADDILGKQSVSARVNHLEKNSHISTSICKSILFRHQLIHLPIPSIFSGWPIAQANIETHLFFRNIAPPHSFLVSRHIVDSTGLFDETLRACEDYDYWSRSVTKGNIFSLAPTGQVFYRKHPGSMSANTLRQVQHDLIVGHRNINRLANDIYLQKHPKLLNMSIACVAGLIHNLEQLHLIDKETSQNIKLILDDTQYLISTLANTPPFSPTNNDVFFYAIRSLNSCKKLQAHNFEQSEILREILMHFFQSKQVMTELREVLFNTIRTVLSRRQLSRFERYRFIKNCAQYLL